MGKRGVLVVGALLALTFWPAAGGATEDTPPATTVVVEPDPAATTVVDPTVPEARVPMTTAPPSPSPVPEARTLTVSPSASLVHDQVVVVRGAGWGGRTSIGATQCLQGVTEIWGCGPITWSLSGRDGRFRADLEVAVILETDDGTYDCRLEACVIAVDDEVGTDRPEIVPITFDTGGPDPVRRVATVTPDTGLVDGQEVVVTAAGIPTGPDLPDAAWLVQCRAPVFDRATDCDLSTWSAAPTDSSGHVDHPHEVTAVLYLNGGEVHDCRTGGCFLAVLAPEDALAEAALVPLGFDPVGPVRPPPTFSMDPAADLVDGEIVTIEGTGWPARAFVVVIPCVSGATDLDDCDTEYEAYFRVDASGDFEQRIGLATELWLGRPGHEVDCRVAACSLFAVVDDWLPRAVELPLDFTPDGPLRTVSAQVTPSTGLHDGDEVTVTGDHARADEYLQLIQCAADTVFYRGCDGRYRDYVETPLRRRADVGLAFETTFTVRQVIHAFDGRTIDCARVPCVLIVNGEIDDMDRAARVPLGFAPAAVAPIGATPTFAG